MLADAENLGSGGGRIAANAFEHAAAVAGDMRQHVDLGIVPIDQMPVVPDLAGGFNHEKIIACGAYWLTSEDLRYDAILFDFDGVLADTEQVHFDCWRELLAPFDIHLRWPFYQKTCVGI